MSTNIQPLLIDADERRDHIRDKTLAGIRGLFPIIGKRHTIDLKDLKINHKDYSNAEQKDALMNGRTLHEPIQGKLVLKDNASGKVLDEKQRTLLHLPYFTRRATFVIGGNEYAVPSQLRLKSGVYTRERNNGEFEAQFNLKKGSNFRLSMEPESGKLNMELGGTAKTSKIPLYALLRILDVPDTDINHYWGADLKNLNATLTAKKEDAVLNKLIGKLKRVGEDVPSSLEGRRAFVKQYFHNTAMDPEVTERTLGVALDRASPRALLEASRKLIHVHKGIAVGDDRDSLAYKTLQSTDDFFKERLDIDAKRTINRKILARMNFATAPDLTKIVPSSVYTKSLTSFLTSSDLSTQPTQINPIEIIDYANKITSLGEGGIPSERGITLQSRKIHNTHYGIIDPVHTPDGMKSGIDLHAALAGHKDAHGNLYANMRNMRTGKIEPVSVMTLTKKIIGFTDQEHRKQHWDAIHGDRMVSVPRHEVDYVLPHSTDKFSPATALVPFLNGMQGNRAIMGSKFQAQALPLTEREAPYVQAEYSPGSSVEAETARLTVPTSPIHGTIHKIDDHYIYIRPDHKTAAAARDKGLVKLPYNHYFPLASKTYLHDTIDVKVGDRVKPHQPLAESNFTKDKTLALGKNLSIAYIAYHGKNSNDAVVISAGAAKKLTSEHMYKYVLSKGPDIVTGKEKYRAYYGMHFTTTQLANIDEHGIAKKGAVVHYGDPLILALRKSAPTPEERLLGSFHRSLAKPYRDATILWDHATPGVVQDVADNMTQTLLTVRTQEPMKIGDKLANRYGGKCVVSEIIDDDKMIQDESKKPLDVLFTSAGIVSRINPAQVVEAALGKVVEKTGKPIIVPQFQLENNIDFAKKLLKEHGLKDKETVYDPMSGKSIPNIFVGRSYIHKLFKSTETNYAARGATSYDANLQPTKGGEAGAKGLGRMEINALLAHNARNVLKDALTVKSEKSDDFWRAYELGLPLPKQKPTFVSDKFVAMLQGAGININKNGTHLSAAPMTDKDVLALSSGALSTPSLEKSKSYMVNAKDLKEETGGLFDPSLTGGLTGKRWSHIELHEPVVNTVFEDATRRLLGLSRKQLRDVVSEHGGGGVRDRLNKLDLAAKAKELREKTKTARGSDLDGTIKQLKYIEALQRNGITRAGDAYTVSKIAVIPPIMRPVLPSAKGNSLQVSDANYLYRDAALASAALASSKETEVPSLIAKTRLDMHDAVAAVFGTQAPVSPQLQSRQVKGFIEQITGSGSPKTGFLHKKILRRQQDLSGRATATPDNTLDIDQIGIPEDMLWTTYGKFIMKGLVGLGYRPLDAREMIESRHPAAKQVLNKELASRPIIVNRAPTLHRHNMVAAYPVAVQGKSLRVNPFMEKGQNLDYDGDAMQLHVPVTDKAVHEARRLTMSNLLFGDKHADDLMVFPQHEAILGTFLATRPSNHAVKTFKTKEDAMKAYHDGTISITSPVKILELEKHHHV